MHDSSFAPAVKIEIDDGVGWVVLNRPGQINAINGDVRRGAEDALKTLDADDSVRVIVIRGEGARGFCAGADIKDQNPSTSLIDIRAGMTPGWIQCLDSVCKPVIAAVHGYCLGGGLELAMACDIRIADPGTIFGLPETGLGLIPGGGGTQRLPRIVGLGRALDLLLTGDRITASEALAMGLVTRVASGAGTLVDEARDLARKIAARPAAATAFAKEAARRGLEMELTAGLGLERDLFTLLMSTEDRREAAAAFREKRAPLFTGR